MRLSKYIKIYPYKEKPGYKLLFSTKRTSTILLHESVLRSIGENNLSSSDEDTLSRLGFLVPDLEEEREEMSRVIDKINHNNNRFNAVVVMNLDCNLACRYCFEGDMKGKLYMTDYTAELLIDFTERYFKKNKNVHYVFYGGEPLLSSELIKYIAGKLKPSAEQKGLFYTFGLVTNGVLLTGKMASDLAALGMKSAKLTLDGPKENHNMCRPFRLGSGSFETIIRNIKESCAIVKIQIGGNYSRENYMEFPRLLDYLIEEGLTPDKIAAVKFDPITKVTNKSVLPDFRDGCESINEPWLLDAGSFLREEILKRGFYTPKITPSPCMIEICDNIVINYDGTFYKCPAFVGRKGLESGDLKTGITDYSQSHNLNSWKTDRCLDCEYLPLCFGGCRFMKLIRDDNMNGVDCKKQYLDATLESFVKQDIRYKPELTL